MTTERQKEIDKEIEVAVKEFAKTAADKYIPEENCEEEEQLFRALCMSDKLIDCALILKHAVIEMVDEDSQAVVATSELFRIIDNFRSTVYKLSAKDMMKGVKQMREVNKSRQNNNNQEYENN